MTKEDTDFGFRIRPLIKKNVESAKPSGPQKTISEKAPAQVAPEPEKGFDLCNTGARFAHAQAALSFLGAIAGAELAVEARARRGPSGRWWIEVPAEWSGAAALAANVGGTPFAGSGFLWVQIPADGSAPEIPVKKYQARKDAVALHGPQGIEQLKVKDWPESGLADLLLATRLRPARLSNLNQVAVAAPGVLARTVLRRALELGFDVRVAVAEQEPLAGGPRSAISWLRISWRQKRIPEAFLHSLTRLPFVAVARPAGLNHSDDAGRSGLLVDIRHAVPLSSSLVAALVPKGEQWLLGGPEVGHWRIRVLGRAGDAAEMIQAPTGPDAAALSPVLPESPHHTEIELRLVPRRPLPGHPDGLLVDDHELGWTQDLLMGKPLAESVFLAFGPGRHLLLAPGGLLESMPFGIPLRRIDSGGLLVQEGRALFPPLPEAARAHAFPCDAEELIALTVGAAEGDLHAIRFRLDQLVPIWQLWIGEPPPVESGVSSEVARKVQALAEALRPPEKTQSLWDRVAPIIPMPDRKRKQVDRDQLLRKALALEHAGRYAEAAQRMEKIGELAAAGRLYERAAGEG